MADATDIKLKSRLISFAVALLLAAAWPLAHISDASDNAAVGPTVAGFL